MKSGLLLLCYWSSHYPAVLYSLTETEIDTFSSSETERETEMFCKTETKYKRESEHMKRNNENGYIKCFLKFLCIHLFISRQWTAADYGTSDSCILPYRC